MALFLYLLAAVACALGVVFLIYPITPINMPKFKAKQKGRQGVKLPGVRILVGLALGLVFAFVTKIPATGILAFFAALGLPSIFARSELEQSIGKLEDVITWAERLRDALSGGQGIGDALGTSTRAAPKSLAEPLAHLGADLHLYSAEEALWRFAEAVNDRSVDKVVAAMVMAVRRSPDALRAVVGELAASLRDDLRARKRVVASRGSIRTSVRLTVGSVVGIIAIAFLVARSFLAPFGTASGQIVLLICGAFIAGGIYLMAKMSAEKIPPRLLVRNDTEGISR